MKKLRDLAIKPRKGRKKGEAVIFWFFSAVHLA
jgi:hypothetical protein